MRDLYALYIFGRFKSVSSIGAAYGRSLHTPSNLYCDSASPPACSRGSALEEERLGWHDERFPSAADDTENALVRANAPAVVLGEMAMILAIALGLALAVNLVL